MRAAADFNLLNPVEPHRRIKAIDNPFRKRAINRPEKAQTDKDAKFIIYVDNNGFSQRTDSAQQNVTILRPNPLT